MSSNPPRPSKTLIKIADAAVGNPGNYQLNFWGQFFMGLVYSLGLLPWHAVGVLLGFVFPGLWVVCTYRLLKSAGEHAGGLPFPKWIIKDPGNTLVIFADLFFLAVIWALILWGLLNQTWVKILFTVVFPLITLSMLRNLVLLLQQGQQPPDEQ